MSVHMLRVRIGAYVGGDYLHSQAGSCFAFVLFVWCCLTYHYASRMLYVAGAAKQQSYREPRGTVVARRAVSEGESNDTIIS